MSPKSDIPKVTVAGRGRINSMMNRLASMYVELNPDRAVRWVYSPMHRPELSTVLGRRAQGFAPVLVEDLHEEIPGMKPDEEVRVGDLILMSIEKEARDEMRAELKERALEQARSVDRAYYDSLTAETVSPSGEVHRARPRGRSVIEELEHSYELKQRTSKE